VACGVSLKRCKVFQEYDRKQEEISIHGNEAPVAAWCPDLFVPHPREPEVGFSSFSVRVIDFSLKCQAVNDKVRAGF